MTAYEHDVATFLKHTSQIRQKPFDTLDPADVDAFAIRAFLGELHKQRISASSSARKLSAIRTFVKFLRRENLVEEDPSSLVAAPKKPQTIPAHLTIDEMTRLLEMPDASNPLGRRDRAVLELFYASGLRLSELVGLGIEDVNLSSRIVRVLGKGKKERLVPFNTSTADALRAWMKDRGVVKREDGEQREDESSRGARSALPELPRRAALDPQRRSARTPIRGIVRREVRHQPARVEAFIRDASARQRRRPSRDSGTAGSCPAQHDPAVYARQCRTTDRGLQEVASARELAGSWSLVVGSRSQSVGCRYMIPRHYPKHGTRPNRTDPRSSAS